MCALNQTCRHSHAPTETVIKCQKHIIFYLLSTPDVGLVIGDGPSSTLESLILEHRLSANYELKMSEKPLYYFVVLDGNLNVDRSISGIIHMFGGIGIVALAFRQHNQARTVHDSELYTASSGTAQALPIRNVLQSLGVHQANPTPVFSDSRSTILCAHDANALKKSLYLTRHVIFMHDARDDGETDYYSCEGKTNPSDPFTKFIEYGPWRAAMHFIMAHPHFA